MTKISGFERVASAFDATEVILAVTLLEGAGYVVLTPGLTLHQMSPNNSLTFGPVPILVPVSDAHDARALLQSTRTVTAAASETSERQSETPPHKRSVWSKVLDLIIFLIAGVSHPRDQLTVDEISDDVAVRGGFGDRMPAPVADP